jgi:hypothetical protein
MELRRVGFSDGDDDDACDLHRLPLQQGTVALGIRVRRAVLGIRASLLRAFRDTVCPASFRAFGQASFPATCLAVVANASKLFVWQVLIGQKVAATATWTKTVADARDETG